MIEVGPVTQQLVGCRLAELSGRLMQGAGPFAATAVAGAAACTGRPAANGSAAPEKHSAANSRLKGIAVKRSDTRIPTGASLAAVELGGDSDRLVRAGSRAGVE